jgi:hypothetical protein
MPITFQKRQKEMKRMEKQRAKAERRAQKKLAKRGENDNLDENIATEGEMETLGLGPTEGLAGNSKP